MLREFGVKDWEDAAVVSEGAQEVDLTPKASVRLRGRIPSP
jgi:hypothetical protein